MECPGVFPWYVQVALGSYHFGKGGWKTFPGVITASWLVMRDGKRSSYVIGSGVNSGIGLGGKVLIALELPAGRVVVGVGTWGASLWTGALGCMGAELEEFPA